METLLPSSRFAVVYIMGSVAELLQATSALVVLVEEYSVAVQCVLMSNVNKAPRGEDGTRRVSFDDVPGPLAVGLEFRVDSPPTGTVNFPSHHANLRLGLEAGLDVEVVSQFCFNPSKLLRWLTRMNSAMEELAQDALAERAK
ncbi:hypothetical protein AK812_SmicGene37817 [Symbiodinium microadriaticum]|uniref:Uncharacterized protein n=1 Tax=Symbiodinium microadriaticum TaxID=2951 RepID=A0A1Q9CFA8_SYMMI|nr:hypothetical protein AK812_SmicGene37817 [Symbiodinium microadriaticum]